MGRAKKFATEQYPERWFRDIDGDSYDSNEREREACEKGYEQGREETLRFVYSYLTHYLWMDDKGNAHVPTLVHDMMKDFRNPEFPIEQ